ncbi:putative 116 kda u5 small nuclear ribonucleoprotein component protein [Eutypa lata UCREL1]|uniref:116 kDa U5 small nuclear ribonucleoprotein component n=1 Tax=Eutypa lata (strain UCR-EL1) TaxID=1287681 RepID=M7STR0_EUTLA|nr:putative 116 kda u5 small nuclear ribonucleoprotein component protein [Eutypa lata UCREL1]
MDDLYDEFGNFIGEEPEASEEESERGIDAGGYLDDEYPEEAPETTGQELMQVDNEGPSNAVVLHEDKQYYPTAQQVYGEDVETMVQEEDAQPLTQPIIAPVDTKKFSIEEADLPPVFFDRSFMTDLMNFPDQIRNIAFAGHLHHGKTAFMDMLVMETHDIADRLEKRMGRKRDEQLRYTDTTFVERERGLSVKASPMSLVLQSTKGKSHLFNIIDTPGHVNFVDEVAAALRLVDGVALIVDVVEGVQVNTEQIIKHAVLEDIPMTLIINKVDRLILELRLPPNDAYFKLKHVVEEVNTIIENTIPGQGEKKRLSPEKGNVLFACTDMGWCFTLQSFSKMYAESFPGVNTEEFARRLWGDIYFNPKKRTFSRKPLPGEDRAKRSFINFVLEPIYKLFSYTISQNPDELKGLLKTLGIVLKPSQLRADARVLLKLVCEQFFGPSTGFVDMVVRHIPSPLEAAERKLEKYYTGPLDSKVAESMKKCDQDGPLVVHVTKLFSTPDAKSFFSLGRVMSGIARPGMQVRVLGEGYSIDDEEDMAMATIAGVSIAETRYNVETSGIPAGNWALLSGIDNSIVKSATLVPPKLEDDEDAYIFKPVTHFTESVLKVAVEPINPSELPKMLDGLRKINKSYPLITTKVEESGEHIILGTGELYMDCVLHDLRRLYADMEIKVSDPVTRFCETVDEMSATKCYAITPNKKNKITMVAEPLDDGIAEDIESSHVKMSDGARKVAKFFEDKYEWDKLAARSIWAFGPDEKGPNILQDDTLPSEVDKSLLRTVRETIRQGFSWAAREGPLCEEQLENFQKIMMAIRNTKFRIMDASLAQEAIFRGGGQVIPTARRACYSAFLMASPRLMEPLYACTMTGPQDSVAAVYTALARRRGHVLSDGPVAGTPLYRVSGLVPVIDSFGLETDIRIQTQGQAALCLVFDRWQKVPGDPLDRDVAIRPLQPADAQATARDFVLKTRRRKGLSEDVSVAKFLEPEFYQSLLESGTLGGS